MSLLMTSQPIVINRDLACRIGLNEAIVLQQLHYWLNETNSGTEHGGIRWVYNTTEQWLEQFPFWSESTLKRTFASLKSLGVLRREKLNKSKRDMTNFYTINYESELLEEVKVNESIRSKCTSPSGQSDLMDERKMTRSIGSKRHAVIGSKWPNDLTENTTEITTWVQIVKDWLKTKGDTGKRKTFVNTTLGETWEPKIGERPDAELMAERKEFFGASVPERVAYLTAGIDSQLDRYEMRVWGWGPGEESWLIDRQIIMGRHDDEATLVRVDEAINKTYLRKNGVEMSVSRICWDIGGIDPTIVYNRSKKHGLFRVIPIKGASVYGKPVANMPRKRNKNGVYLTEVGTDTAKEQIYNRFTLQPEGSEPLAGAVHFPNNPEIYDLAEAQQLTAEEQVEKWVDGRKKIVWDSKKRRNEALDCFVYALAALRISISRWQLNLDSLLASLLEEEGNRTNNKTLADYARALSGDE